MAVPLFTTTLKSLQTPTSPSYLKPDNRQQLFAHIFKMMSTKTRTAMAALATFFALTSAAPAKRQADVDSNSELVGQLKLAATYVTSHSTLP
jgi:hypothetical protein